MFAQCNVLLPTDFSHYALYAMKYAVAICEKYGGTLHIAHVMDSALFGHGHNHGFGLTQNELDRLIVSMEEHAERRLAHLCRMAGDAGVKAEWHLVRGKAANRIIGLLDEADCGLVVLATHGRTGVEHIVFGSVAEKVVRHSPVPVLSIKHPEHEFVQEDEDGIHFDLKRILFPTDFSELSDKSLPYATSMCREFDATLVLLHASEVPVVLPEFMPDAASVVEGELRESAEKSLDNMRKQLEGVRIETVACSGLPHREICHTVQGTHVDLVVMPTHGRSGFGHVLFGSVAEKTVRMAQCPVLTVRPGGGAPVLPEEEEAEVAAGVARE